MPSLTSIDARDWNVFNNAASSRQTKSLFDTSHNLTQCMQPYQLCWWLQSMACL